MSENDWSIPFDELVLVPSGHPLIGPLIRRMPDPTLTWTSHMEGDIEE